jgi:hypothetical protein
VMTESEVGFVHSSILSLIQLSVMPVFVFAWSAGIICCFIVEIRVDSFNTTIAHSAPSLPSCEQSININ